MQYQVYPILEFDPTPLGKLTACAALSPQAPKLPELCVITFFRDSLTHISQNPNFHLLGYLHSEIVDLPIYVTKVDGKEVCITLAFSGSAGAAATLEELRAMGAKRFVVCGGAGCLAPDLTVGNLLLPSCAVRDEGASYHYLPASREVSCCPDAVRKAAEFLKEKNVPFLECKTWTTDAIYRETPDKIALRRSENCMTVEMESAAFFAVSQFYSLPLVQLFYAGDDLSGEKWDLRGWTSRRDVRENLILLSLDLVTLL